MHNYSYIVDGGLHVCSRAKDEPTARRRIEQAWPRSTITLKGVDLPSAERKVVPTMGSATKAHERKVEAPKPAKDRFDGLDLDETERSLVAAFA